ncbi:MAG: hypothetical protein R3C51_00295 [Parvularculaceae bacterium]
MKAFEITEYQASSVISALIADELGVHFSRHFDSLTTARWAADTTLGADGIGLTPDERAACVRRITDFFGAETNIDPSVETIGAWAGVIADVVLHRQVRFTFASAAASRREIAHAADDIYADAAAAANLIYGRRRLLTLVAPHSLFGFALSVLAPNLLQVPSIDARALTPEALTKAMSFGDALVATPSLWRYVIRSGVVAPDNAMAVYFGEPMAGDLAADMRKAGFGAQRELYGSTETGVIGWRDSPGEAFVLFDHWRRAGDMLERTSPGGGVTPVDAMDTLVWENDRRFKLAGRRDGAVQIGAVNVFPDRIAAKICEHPIVKTCVISVSRHAGGANRLIADIELDNAAPGESLARSIDSWCRAKLRPQERPRVYNFR